MDLVLYRFFDAGGALLYVGKTVNPWQRLTAHGRTLVRGTTATITLERFATDEELAAAEARAIYVEQPEFNVNLKTRVPVDEPGGPECGAGACVGLVACVKISCACCLRDRKDGAITERLASGVPLDAVAAEFRIRPELAVATHDRVVTAIRRRAAGGHPVDLAKAFGVSRAKIYNVLKEGK